ncbi:hypothetical protein Aam_012_008 [Acidocella aminolytica 101 = DSM 11237]|uniref:Transposase n=1 Tax=Acidocella aminolytica 101 = DSM 11237 TaxID=1120923 RepID=A0A0D6PDM1_9PROT|nr:hypothetical protein Aam_012_008 [Acidocella aminolytica 101 = DSM 11237]
MAQRYIRDVEDGAVRLVRTSGYTRRAIAEDLGIGISPLTRWLCQRRENENLRQERWRGPPSGIDVQWSGRPASLCCLFGKVEGGFLKS